MAKPSNLPTCTRKLLDGEKALIVCIGDSITEQNSHLHGHLNDVGMLDETLTEKYPHRVVLLMTQNPLNFDLPDNLRMRGSYPLYVDAIKEIAASREIPLCDVYRAWETHISEFPYDRKVWMDDDIHPNEHGHRFIARELLDYLSHA